jgi:hypothetical protein
MKRFEFGFRVFSYRSFQVLVPNTSDLIKRIKQLEDLVEIENKQLENIQENYAKIIRANRLLKKVGFYQLQFLIVIFSQ